MTSKIGVGIIGAGGISRSHLQAYRAWPGDCRMVAVADIVPEKAQQFAAAAGLESWYTDYHELLRRPDVDLVSVCTPPFVHAPATIAALQAGKHVICVKPMAASLQECDAMIATAGRSAKLLSISFPNRFSPGLWRARAVVESGLLGPLLFGRCETRNYRGATYYERWWRGTWEMECGGATMGQGVHYIDALLWLMGQPVKLYAEMATLAHDIEVEDLSIAIVRFAGGALGQVTSTVNAHHTGHLLEVTGRDASVGVPWHLAARITDAQGARMVNQALLDRLSALAAGVELPAGEGHVAMVGDMLRAIRTGGRPLVGGNEGRKSLQLITGIYKSASTGQWVDLPLAGDDAFYSTEGLRRYVKRHSSSKTAPVTADGAPVAIV